LTTVNQLAPAMQQDVCSSPRSYRPSEDDMTAGIPIGAAAQIAKGRSPAPPLADGLTGGATVIYRMRQRPGGHRALTSPTLSRRRLPLRPHIELFQHRRDNVNHQRVINP
jgi:hypothetical protein